MEDRAGGPCVTGRGEDPESYILVITLLSARKNPGWKNKNERGSGNCRRMTYWASQEEEAPLVGYVSYDSAGR